MKETNLIYERIEEKIRENNGFDELVIFDIENVFGNKSVITKNKERKNLKIKRAKRRLKNFDNYFNLTKNSLLIISAHRRLLEDLDKWYFDESPPVEILISAKGKDGADLALIDSAEFILESDLISNFKEVVVVSGDHIFTPLVRKLKEKKIKYTTVSQNGSGLSNKILKNSENHVVLDTELEYAAA